MVESVGNGGHKKWQAWIIQWWSPLAGVDAPRTTETDENAVAPPSRWDDVLYEIVLDPDYELFAALPRLERWRGFIEAHYGYGLGDVEHPTTDVDEMPSRTVSPLSGRSRLVVIRPTRETNRRLSTG